MALSKQDLLWILQDLADEDLDVFKLYLREKHQGAVRSYSGIQRAPLMRATRVDIVELMVDLYTVDLPHITATILCKMRKFALLQTLVNRMICTSGAGASPHSLQSNPPVSAHQCFPLEFLDFIICWSQNKELMSRILSDLAQILVQVQTRSQQSMFSTFTGMFALGAAVSYIYAPLLPTICPTPKKSLAFASCQGLVLAGVSVKYLDMIHHNQELKDQNRVRELERELETLLLRLLFKLLPLWMSRLHHSSRTLVQRTIHRIREVLQRSYGPRPDPGFDGISELARHGHRIVQDLSEIKDQLYSTRHNYSLE